MLQGPIDPACPASLLRRHGDAHVLLDPAAAAELTRR
jgi:6-phosphogluconolactonase/glucosamine-6-phosphate isomerase/deaminase